jgi:1-acyl-sn-glycerol-3-phosphate acyltransferase
MRPMGRFIASVARLGLEVMCRIDKSELHKVPPRGPLIAYSNHTGSVEVPIVFTELQPRPLTGLAKIESWNGWFLRWVFNAWDAIPLRRGEADMAAMNKALEALRQGYILGMSPEGTRNKTGELIRGQSGIVTLALHSHSPLLPLANWGGESFRSNLRRFRRTDFHMRVGEPFTLDTRGERVTREVRQKMVDEMMYKLAALLPERYRGYYADLDQATERYIVHQT